MRVALAGLGAAAMRGHLPAIRHAQSQGALRLVAAADSTSDRRAAARAEWPDLPVFESAETMLSAIASEVFVIATNPAAHVQLIALGVERGQHVVCEKPLALARAEHDGLRRTYETYPELALVAVHQYSHSPTWMLLARWLRLVNRLRIPFSISVRVDRLGADRLAMSPWREMLTVSGGMLADHGPHFLALGWMIGSDVEALSCHVRLESVLEEATALIRIGVGILNLQLTRGAPLRRTTLEGRVGRTTVTWIDDVIALSARSRVIKRWHTDALSDRGYVDGLYLPFYKDVAANLSSPAWRRTRTAETLRLNDLLISLLEMSRG